MTRAGPADRAKQRVVVAQVAALSAVLCGFATPAIVIGATYVARAGVQRAADGAVAVPAAQAGIRICCIGPDGDPDWGSMAQVVSSGRCGLMHAAGLIEDHSVQLGAMFAEVGGKRPVVPIE